MSPANAVDSNGNPCVDHDPLYPGGCPSGYSLVDTGGGGAYYQGPQIGKPSCHFMACQDPAGKTPAQNAQAGCPPDYLFYGLAAGAIIAVVLLPGWYKLASIGLGAYALLEGISTVIQAEQQPDGSWKCVKASW